MANFHCIFGHVYKRNKRGAKDPHGSLADSLAALDSTVQQSLVRGSHPDSSLNTNPDHGNNRERSERCPGPYEGNFEEFAIYSLQRLSTTPTGSKESPIVMKAARRWHTSASFRVTAGFFSN